jgi:energy-coupling factor transport system ATP-binding protein
MDDFIIRASRLHYTYPGREEPTLKGVDIAVGKGEFVLLTGPTGCGKSTLLKAINGLIPHVFDGRMAGRVFVDGVDTMESTMAALSQKVGLVFQNPDDQIFSTMVMDEAAFGPENLGLPRDVIRRRVHEALRLVGLGDLLHRSTHKLSGGQKQRLAIASVLVMKPKALLLDEPFAQLDPRGTREVLEVVRRLNREGMTIVLVEHRVHEVVDAATRMIVMADGEVVQDGSPRKVFEKPDAARALGLRVPDSVAFSWAMGFKEVALNLEEVKDRLRSHVKGAEAGWGPPTWEDGRDAPDRSARPLAGIRAVAEGESAPALVAEGVSFRYEKKSDPSLTDVNITIRSGEVVALMGNNGSGKSTLLLHFAGLLRPETGCVTVMGRDTRKVKPWKLAGMVGIVFQNPTLMLFNDTVREEMEFGPKALHVAGDAVTERVEDLVRLMGLAGRERDNPLALSGGQRLRVALASILSMQPQVVLFDEPTSGQDKANSDNLLQSLSGLARSGATVLFSTHDVDAAIRHSDRLVIMNRGRIVADGPPREVVRMRRIMEDACLSAPLAFHIGGLMDLDAYSSDDFAWSATC